MPVALILTSCYNWDMVSEPGCSLSLRGDNAMHLHWVQNLVNILTWQVSWKLQANMVHYSLWTSITLAMEDYKLYMGQKLQDRDGKKCSECLNFTLTQRVTLSKPFIIQTWVFYPVGYQCLGHLHNFHLPGTTFKGLKFKGKIIKNWPFWNFLP